MFYLYFDDLDFIIQNNWELFSSYLPDMSWIISKVSEFSKGLNLVVHNSDLEKQEKRLERTIPASFNIFIHLEQELPELENVIQRLLFRTFRN